MSAPKSRRGYLLSRMEWSNPRSGVYLIEGLEVQRSGRAWIVCDVDGYGHTKRFDTLTDALEYVADQIGVE